jgi:hypothetical protein
MASLFGGFLFLVTLYPDGGYQGPEFQSAMKRILARVNVEIVKRSDRAEGFLVVPSDGSSNAHLPGSAAAGGRRKIGNSSIARPLPSSASALSASCCESYAIFLGQSLRH